jgi:hypothetical protein
MTVCLTGFSAKTSICTSMEELKALVTFAFNVTTLPRGIGSLKEILSTDAVTTTLLQCLRAAIAETTSIKYIKRPPIRLLSVLVSFGSTISVIVVNDSLANLDLDIAA